MHLCAPRNKPYTLYISLSTYMSYITNRLHLRQIEHGIAQVGRKTDGKQTDVINNFEQRRKVLRKQIKSNLIFYLSYRNVHIIVERNKTP